MAQFDQPVPDEQAPPEQPIEPDGSAAAASDPVPPSEVHSDPESAYLRVTTPFLDHFTTGEHTIHRQPTPVPVGEVEAILASAIENHVDIKQSEV